MFTEKDIEWVLKTCEKEGLPWISIDGFVLRGEGTSIKNVVATASANDATTITALCNHLFAISKDCHKLLEVMELAKELRFVQTYTDFTDEASHGLFIIEAAAKLDKALLAIDQSEGVSQTC